jgi:hypothetical protein
MARLAGDGAASRVMARPAGDGAPRLIFQIARSALRADHTLTLAPPRPSARSFFGGAGCVSQLKGQPAPPKKPTRGRDAPAEMRGARRA